LPTRSTDRLLRPITQDNKGLERDPVLFPGRPDP